MRTGFDPEQIERVLTCLRSHPGDIKVIALKPPKTASMHFSGILQTEYKREKERRCNPWASLHARPPIRLTRNFTCSDDDFFSEPPRPALWLELEEEAVKAGVPILALVRDPVEFMLSYYSFAVPDWKKKGDDWKADLLALVKADHNDDSQLGLLTGRRFVTPFFLPAHCNETLEVSSTREVDFDRLRQRVEEGRVLLGTVEDFEGSIRYFASALKWERFQPDSYDFSPRGFDRFRINNSGRIGDVTVSRLLRSEVPEEILAEIVRHSALDARLHAFAASSMAAGLAALHTEL